MGTLKRTIHALKELKTKTISFFLTYQSHLEVVDDEINERTDFVIVDSFLLLFTIRHGHRHQKRIRVTSVESRNLENVEQVSFYISHRYWQHAGGIDGSYRASKKRQ